MILTPLTFVALGAAFAFSLMRLVHLMDRWHKSRQVEKQSEDARIQELAQMCQQAFQEHYFEELGKDTGNWGEDQGAWQSAPPVMDWSSLIRETDRFESSRAVFTAWIKGGFAGKAENKRRQPQQFDLFANSP